MRLRHRIPTEALAAIALALVLGCGDSLFAAEAIVYQCQHDGVRMFSDRPCGDDARPRQVDITRGTIAAPSARIAPPTVRPKQAVGERPHRTAPSRRDANSDCHALQQQIDAIDTRMRLGYRGKEGEKLHARRRAATELYRERRCNTTARGRR